MSSNLRAAGVPMISIARFFLPERLVPAQVSRIANITKDNGAALVSECAAEARAFTADRQDALATVHFSPDCSRASKVHHPKDKKERAERVKGGEEDVAVGLELFQAAKASGAFHAGTWESFKSASAATRAQTIKYNDTAVRTSQVLRQKPPSLESRVRARVLASKAEPAEPRCPLVPFLYCGRILLEVLLVRQVPTSRLI